MLDPTLTVFSIVAVLILAAWLWNRYTIRKALRELSERNTSDHTTDTWDNTDKRCIHGKLCSQDLNPPCRWPVDHEGIPQPSNEDLWAIVTMDTENGVVLGKRTTYFGTDGID